MHSILFALIILFFLDYVQDVSRVRFSAGEIDENTGREKEIETTVSLLLYIFIPLILL